MSYSSYGARLTSTVSNLKTNNNDMINMDFASSWEGGASRIQLRHLDELHGAVEDVLAAIDTLNEVLNDIDSYDAYKLQIKKWEDRLASLDPDDEAAIADAQVNIAKARNSMNERKSVIQGKINGINAKYTSSLTVIPPTEVVSTNDVFANVFSSSSNISSSFDVSQYVTVNYNENPNFNNTEAWVYENPYSQAGLYGQCTWFAWGKFYEMYGYSPGFTGNGNQCAYQLVNSHPDKFEISNTPQTGAVFSYKGYPYGHTGVITEVKDGMLTYQDGNYDGVTNSFEVAKHDWGTKTVPVQDFINRYGGNIVFANPKTYTC